MSLPSLTLLEPGPAGHTGEPVRDDVCNDAYRPPARTKPRRIPVRAVLKVIACIAVFGYIVNLLRLLASSVDVRATQEPACFHLDNPAITCYKLTDMWLASTGRRRAQESVEPREPVRWDCPAQDPSHRQRSCRHRKAQPRHSSVRTGAALFAGGRGAAGAAVLLFGYLHVRQHGYTEWHSEQGRCACATPPPFVLDSTATFDSIWVARV